MKRLLPLLIFTFIGFTIQAQTDGLNYQAVIINPDGLELPGVNSEGNILPNYDVVMRFTIFDGSGGIEYQETQVTRTDAYGMINVIIGSGQSQDGRNFSDIYWDGTTKDLMVEVRFDGQYKNLSKQQLTFVPYAFHRDIIATGTMNVDGAVLLKDALEVDGAVYLKDILEVDGETDLNSKLSVNNESPTELTGTLTVEKESNLNSALSVNNASPTILSGTLETDGAANFNSTLEVDGTTTLNNSLDVTNGSPTGLSGSLRVDGETNLNNHVFINNDSNLNLSGDLLVEGATVFGDDLTVNGETNLNSNLNVNNASPTNLGGTLVVDQATMLNSSLKTFGATVLESTLDVNNQSPVNFTGTLTVDNATNLNSSLDVNNAAPTNLSGTLNVDLETNLNSSLDVNNGAPTDLSGTLNVVSDTRLNSTLAVEGVTDLNNTLNVNNLATSNLSGELNVDGATNLNSTLEVDGNTDLNNELSVDGVTNLNNTLNVNDLAVSNLSGELNVDGATNLNSTLEVDGNTDLNNELSVDGVTNLNNTLNVNDLFPSNLSGVLNVDGATNLNSVLNVNNLATSNLSGELNVGGAANLSGTMEVGGITNLNSSLNVNNAAPTILSGTLNVDLATQLNGSLFVNNAAPTILSGTLDVGGELRPTGGIDLNNIDIQTGQLTVSKNFPSGNESNYDAYPLRVEGGAQGIAVKVAHPSPFSPHNFVTFFDANGGIRGRIEGQSVDDLFASTDYIVEQAFFALDVIFMGLEAAACATGLDPVEAIAVGANAVRMGVEQITTTVLRVNDIGVSYQSGGADYAEWLPKLDKDELIYPGDIVAVSGGKISKNFSNSANVQFMVASSNPIVVGNMPEEGQEQYSVKIAFMGQVPVKVRGSVAIGDYIVVSDLQDGFGTAVHPDDMTLKDYNKIVGIAWSVGNNPSRFNKVNVAVGVNSNDLTGKMMEQQKELDMVKREMNSVIAYLKTKDPSFQAVEFDLPAQEIANVSSSGKSIFESSNNKESNTLKFLEESIRTSPQVVAELLAETRAILDEWGVDYNKNEIAKRILTDQEYFIAIMKERYK